MQDIEFSSKNDRSEQIYHCLFLISDSLSSAGVPYATQQRKNSRERNGEYKDFLYLCAMFCTSIHVFM